MSLQEKINRLNRKYQKELIVGLWIGDATKVFYQQQEQLFFKAASIIKLAVYDYYIAQSSEKKLDLQTKIMVSPETIVGGAGVLQLFPGRTHWQIDELLTAMIAVSDNTATNLLLDFAGLENIQNWLQNKSGVVLERKLMHPEKDKENLITAYGAGQLMLAIVEAAKTMDQLPDLTPFFSQQFREGLPGLLDERELPHLRIANKTGRLDRIEHDVAYFSSGEKEWVIAALSQDITGKGCGIMWLRQVGELVYNEMSKASL